MSIRQASGFTIVELIIVIIVAAVLTGILYGPVTTLYINNQKGIRNVSAIASVRSAAGLMQTSTQTANAFEDAISDPVNSKNWSYQTSGSNNVLIIDQYATTIPESQDTANARKLTQATDCRTAISNFIVFFVQNDNLYRRVVKNTAATCAGHGNGIKQTCAAGNHSASCGDIDALLARNVSSISVVYYSDTAGTTVATGPSGAKAATVTINAYNGSGANKQTAVSKIRVTLIN